MMLRDVCRELEKVEVEYPYRIEEWLKDIKNWS